MKNLRKSLQFLAVLALLGLAQACNLPNSSAPTPFVFPTPDLTLTAIFAPLASIQAPVVQTATPVPLPDFSPTPAVPNATALPSPTLSPLPGTPLATNTSPAATNAPPASSTPPAADVTRTAGRVQAARVDDPPSIDGDLDDWTVGAVPVEKVVFGPDRWDGRDDLSASLRVTWDSDFLYLGVSVTDEDYVQNATGNMIYQGDSLELLVDTNLAGDFSVDSLSPDDFQLGISPGSGEPGEDMEVYLWYPSSLTGRRPEVDVDASRTDDGYDVEVSIPWSVFGITPRSGARFGFAFAVSDNDRTGDQVQQSMVSNIPNRHLTDPTTWGELVLQ